MSLFTTAQTSRALYAHVKGPDGKVRYMGRIDRKWWAPRAWFYRWITFPILKRRYADGHRFNELG